MKKSILAITLAILLLAVPAAAAAQEISVVTVPNPIELPEILFIVALVGFACWKTSWVRVILSVGIIIWGVFTLEYDVKFAAPLISVGAILFIAGIMKMGGWAVKLREQ